MGGGGRRWAEVGGGGRRRGAKRRARTVITTQIKSLKLIRQLDRRVLPRAQAPILNPKKNSQKKGERERKREREIEKGGGGGGGGRWEEPRAMRNSKRERRGGEGDK